MGFAKFLQRNGSAVKDMPVEAESAQNTTIDDEHKTAVRETSSDETKDAEASYLEQAPTVSTEELLFDSPPHL